VVVAGRREDEGSKTIELIRGSGDGHFVKTDVSQSDQVAALLAEVVER
jgi:NAD(P)-dependent dehydrogenase (short-subunit alcohol dehydrogenase family)